MDFSDAPRPQAAESVVPMINVVFLLLIFFLMTAEIAPPDPIALDLPEAGASAEITAPLPVYLAKDGTLAFRDVESEAAVLRALELERIALCADGGCNGAQGPSIAIHADREVSASALAALLPKLAALGFPKVELVTKAGGDA